jgi:glycosyltransferase involved in cell wall biosynthesis
MAGQENARMRNIHISRLRKNPKNQESIKFLIDNSKGEYRLILISELILINPISENILHYFKYLFNNINDSKYTKKEAMYWTEKISENISNLNIEDLEKLIHLINIEMAKQPLLTREITLFIIKKMIEEGNISKLNIINTKTKNNLLDQRHKYLLSKFYKEERCLILAYETIEKYADSLIRISLKNNILIEIGRFAFGENEFTYEEVTNGMQNDNNKNEKIITDILNRHSEIFKYEYEKLRKEKNGQKIKLKLIIDSLKEIDDFYVQDLFIREEIRGYDVVDQLIKCDILAIKGIIERAFQNENKYLSLCQSTIDILEITEKTKSNIILQNILTNRLNIPYDSALNIINYVRENISKFDNLVILRTAKLCEGINNLKLGIEILNSIDTISSRELIQEFKIKKKWLENGYDIDEIINSFNDTKINPIENKILYFVHSDLPHITSGYTIRTKSVINALLNCGFKIEVMTRWGFPSDRSDYKNTTNDKIDEQWIDKNGIKHNVDPSFGGMSDFHNIDYLHEGVKRLLIKCHEMKPSIIIAASDHVSGLIGLITSKILKIPFIYEMRGLWAYTRATNNISYGETYDFNLRLQLERQCALNADKVITISEKLSEIIVNWGVLEKNIQVLPNGIESLEDLSKNNGDNNKIPKIGYIGSIVPYEGLITTIQSIKLMKDKGRITPKVIIVGDGTDKNNLENYVEKNDLSDYIEFRGKINHDMVNNFYEEIDAIILPRLSSLVTDIVPPLKPLEAIGKGKIVISSMIDPHKELFDNIENSFQFIPGDIESQAATISEFINYEGDIQEIINQSYEFVLRNRNYNKMIGEISKVISKLLIDNHNDNNS